MRQADGFSRLGADHERAAVVRAAADAGFDAAQFRAQVRRFCEEQVPADIAANIRTHRIFTREQRIRWQRLLQAQGWLCAHWPRAHGGQDWGPLQRFIFIEELERAGTPWLTHFGVSFLGPVLCEFGNPAQRERWLPAIRDSQTWWCQGFSEPGAGSDLASLNLRAEREGATYRVNGQKTWTTLAQWADAIFCLVRTDPGARPQQGISFLLVDLRSPGVTVRPIETFDGGHHVNEVFFDDVIVPAENRVGAEGQGWAIAKFIVSRERLLVTEIGKAAYLFNELHERARACSDGSGSVADSARFRRRSAELERQYRSLRATAYAAVLEAQAGNENPMDASLLKIRGSELQQALQDAMIEVLGRDSLAFDPAHLRADAPLEPAADAVGDPCLSGLLHEHLHSRATSIYGGSNEIQRGIIAKFALAG